MCAPEHVHAACGLRQGAVPGAAPRARPGAPRVRPWLVSAPKVRPWRCATGPSLALSEHEGALHQGSIHGACAEGASL
eukprot:3935386-Alexandrium_andersonii.AAC.1